MKIILKFIQIKYYTWKTLQKRANQVADFRFTFQGSFGIVELEIWTRLFLEKL